MIEIGEGYFKSGTFWLAMLGGLERKFPAESSIL